MKLKINHILLLLSMNYIYQNINASSIKKYGKPLQPIAQRGYVTLPSMWTHEENEEDKKEEATKNTTSHVPYSWISKFNQLYKNKNITYPNIDENELDYTGALLNADGTKTRNFTDSFGRITKINYDENNLKRNASIVYPEGTIVELDFDKNENVESKVVTDPYGKLKIKFYKGPTSWILTPLPSDYDIYVYNENGKYVGPSGKYDENGLDRNGRTADNILEELD